MAESKKIVRVYFAKFKEAFYILSDEEKMEFMRKDRAEMDQLRMKLVMMIDCRWSNEEWDFVRIEEWPTIEALEKRAKFEEQELEAFRYTESKIYLGTLETSAYGKE